MRAPLLDCIINQSHFQEGFRIFSSFNKFSFVKSSFSRGTKGRENKFSWRLKTRKNIKAINATP